ncbi:MAG: type II secretion system minor pseudopilin GspK [Dokdonella sp.]|nr:type II secretion system minor pseudopilin GspK [Dokdonella sp.]
MNGPHRQRGVALLIALLAVALALVLIGSLLDRGELALARTRNVLRGEQAIAYSEGLEAFAAQVLMRDLDESPNLDTFSDSWAIPLPPQQVPGGTLSARMTDLNGCFNLNNLVSPSTAERALWRRRLDNLLVALELDPALVGAIVDWLDADGSIDNEGGAEDSAYLAQPVPYRTANRVFAHVSELRLVRGISNEVYARLAPEVCALPPGTALNLNTASAALLMSLDSRMTQALALRIRQNGQARWISVENALNEAENQGVRIPPENRLGLGVTSSYFLARGEITLDDIPFSFSSLLERVTGTARGGVHVLERSRGAEDAPNPALARKLTSRANR